MEPNKNIEQAASNIHWKRAEPAPEKETQSFWKKLRYFYRTGENTEKQVGNFSSALLHLLDNNSAKYPFVLGDEANKTTTIKLEEKAPFYLLDHLLKAHQKGNRISFKVQLSELIAGLNRLLRIDDKSSEADLRETYDFADEMIAFDKMVEIMPQDSSEIISETRLARLTVIISTLQKGLKLLNEQDGILVLEKEFKDNLRKTSIFTKAKVVKVSNDPFNFIQELFTEQMGSYTSLIKACRIASLEIESKYKEDIHDEYFDHFTYHRLLPEELNLFHPIILVIHPNYLFQYLASFSRLMASNQPINVVVLNHELSSTPDQQVTWEDASHQFRQELAALAIAHRNVYTFQSSMDEPMVLYNGLANCLKSSFPGICHLSVPKDGTASKHSPLLISKAENVGRYFPRILYDPAKTNEWGGRFDLSENIQPKEIWPKFALKAHTSGEMEVEIDVAFTYADYKAIYPEKAKELMVIPSTYYTEHLIPLSKYLVLDEASLYGKIPYIWLIDETNGLYRAAVPNVWVVSCQERLDFWSFLQELGGLNSYHANAALKQKEIEMVCLKEEANVQIDSERQQIIENAREEAIAKAAERLISVLLDDEDISFDEAVKDKEPIDEQANSSLDILELENHEHIEGVANTQVVSNEPWVESDDCTSCNECTDQSPNLFMYNEEKQAYIDDHTKGTYEELVKAAEKCPAACIHPGMPLNPAESNLDKWIKRAEKFN